MLIPAIFAGLFNHLNDFVKGISLILPKDSDFFSILRINLQLFLNFNSFDSILYPLHNVYSGWGTFNNKLLPSLLSVFVIFLIFVVKGSEDLMLYLLKLLFFSYFFRWLLRCLWWGQYVYDRLIVLLIWLVVGSRVEEICLEIDEVDGSLYHFNTVCWSFWERCDGLNNLRCTLFNPRKLSSSISSSHWIFDLFDSWLLKSSTSLARNC